MSRPLICAHRGASAYYPENSREAILAAIDLGADMIETDVRRAPDGVLVLSHQPPGSSEGLVTLAEFLELAGDHVIVDLELKESGYEADVVAALEPRPAGLVVSSFDPACVAAIRALAPDVETALLFGERAVGTDLFAQADEVRRRSARAAVLPPDSRGARPGAESAAAASSSGRSTTPTCSTM